MGTFLHAVDSYLVSKGYNQNRVAIYALCTSLVSLFVACILSLVLVAVYDASVAPMWFRATGAVFALLAYFSTSLFFYLLAEHDIFSQDILVFLREFMADRRKWTKDE